MGGWWWRDGWAGVPKNTERPAPFAPIKKMLKARVQEQNPKTIADLKKAIGAAWYSVDMEEVKRAVATWPKRVEKCIEAGGGRFGRQL